MKELQSHFANYDTTWRDHDPRDLRQVILINGFFIRAFSRSYNTLAEVSAELYREVIPSAPLRTSSH